MYSEHKILPYFKLYGGIADINDEQTLLILFSKESGIDQKITRKSEKVDIVKGGRHRRLHRTFLRYRENPTD